MNRKECINIWTRSLKCNLVYLIEYKKGEKRLIWTKNYLSNYKTLLSYFSLLFPEVCDYELCNYLLDLGANLIFTDDYRKEKEAQYYGELWEYIQ